MGISNGVLSVSVLKFLATVYEKFVRPNEIFEVTGDIPRYLPGTDTTDRYVLVDTKDVNRSIQLILSKKKFKRDKAEAGHPYMKHHVRVQGWMMVDNKSAIPSIYVTAIHNFGECQYLKKEKEWEKTYQQRFFSREDQLRFLERTHNFQKIEVLCGCESLVYGDFEQTLDEALRPKVHRTGVPINQISSIAEAIQNLNKANACDCICILRGGGGPEVLHRYSHPKLLEAILGSKIPMVTGIGHAEDRPLCQRVANYPAITPTAAANFFNYAALIDEVEKYYKEASPPIGGLKVPMRKLKTPQELKELDEEYSRVQSLLDLRKKDFAALRNI